MGIAFEIASKLAKVVQEFSINGLALSLGKQDIHFNRQRLSEILHTNGFMEKVEKGVVLANYQLIEREISQSQGLSCKAEFKQKEYISDTLLFGSLGLIVESLDVSDYEGADYIYDLNDTLTPDNLKEKFDLVFDGGTMEHVFHIPNALNNIFSMLKIGGCVIHGSPVNNYVDHGFYQFSPTIFYDYYYANNFEILQCSLFRHSQDHDKEPWMFMEYAPGRLDTMSFGGLDDKMYGTWFVARKTEKSTCSVIPQQGVFKKNMVEIQQKKIENYLITQIGDRGLILFGANDIADKMLQNQIIYDKTVTVIDSFKNGDIRGQHIQRINYLNNLEGQVVLITSSKYATEIMGLITVHNLQNKFEIMQFDTMKNNMMLSRAVY